MELIKSCIDQNGRLIIPVQYRKKLHLKPNMEVLLRIDNDELYVCSRDKALADARNLINQYIDKDVDLVEELFKMRREEVSRE